MKFKTITVQGHGRGKDLGFPTINMQVLPEMVLGMKEGIYAARVTISGQNQGAAYGGALYYGPGPRRRDARSGAPGIRRGSRRCPAATNRAARRSL
jgi:FAD synthase